MKVLDLDIDYFMKEVVNGISEDEVLRLSDTEYSKSVWTKEEVINFIENNLGLTKSNKIKGKIVEGHNEALYFWEELINAKKLIAPFEVVHVDSHADLGLGYSSWKFILDELLKKPVVERIKCKTYIDSKGNIKEIGIGDYLLYAICYRWISKLTYCANPNGDKNDYIIDILKNYDEKPIFEKEVTNIIQLVYNNSMKRPDYCSPAYYKEEYFKTSISDPEIPFCIIPTIEGVNFKDGFDYIVVAKSPNYTPSSIDFVIDIIREYIDEIEVND